MIPPATRALRPDDLDAALALNRAAEPGVGPVDREALAALMADATLGRIAEEEGRALGFVLCLPPGLAYASKNYRWFDARGDDFLYVDRVAVAAEARGRGVGAALYTDVFAAAGRRPVCCEVNSMPPNPWSLRFHATHGFVEVGRVAHEPGVYEVVFLTRAASESQDTKKGGQPS